MTLVCQAFKNQDSKLMHSRTPPPPTPQHKKKIVTTLMIYHGFIQYSQLDLLFVLVLCKLTCGEHFHVSCHFQNLSQDIGER